MGETRSEIQEFFRERAVLVTGGTGFLGKVLIEKLLRSTDVATVFVLVREKKGKGAHTRLDEILDGMPFDRLKREKPKFKNRIEAIAGDCSLPGLGLSIADRQRLIVGVDVVFHAAATVNFNEPLRAAYAANVAGTEGVLRLARAMERLKSIIHVSTAYSHCPRMEISEEFYDCPVRWDAVGALLEKAGDEEVEQLTPRLLGNWPNTYTFTKALSESVVKELGEGLPVAVFRPGIVVSSFREPVPGWTDNLYGPTGVAAGALGGALRAMRVRGSARADVVPVDTCVAAALAAAAERRAAGAPAAGGAAAIPVYNYVSSPENPITWDEYIQLSVMHGRALPYARALWSTFVVFTASLPAYLVLRALLHTLPALLVDGGAVLVGRRPRMLATYRKIHRFTDIIQYFATRDWRFRNRNVANMWEKAGRRDRELFPFSVTTVQWLAYSRAYIRGVRTYLLRDADATLGEARRRRRRLDALNQALKCALVYALGHLLMRLARALLSTIFE